MDCINERHQVIRHESEKPCKIDVHFTLGCHGHVEAAMERSNNHQIKPMTYHKTFLQAPDLHSTGHEKKFLYLIGYGINYAADRTIIADQYIADSEGNPPGQ